MMLLAAASPLTAAAGLMIAKAVGRPAGALTVLDATAGLDATLLSWHNWMCEDDALIERQLIIAALLVRIWIRAARAGSWQM